MAILGFSCTVVITWEAFLMYVALGHPAYLTETDERAVSLRQVLQSISVGGFCLTLLC